MKSPSKHVGQEDPGILLSPPPQHFHSEYSATYLVFVDVAVMCARVSNVDPHVCKPSTASADEFLSLPAFLYLILLGICYC